MTEPERNDPGGIPFREPATISAAVSGEAAAMLAMAAGDVTLLLDATGTILDASSSRSGFAEIASWIGRRWRETATVESAAKIEDLLAGGDPGQRQLPRWRQINHVTPAGDVPVRYIVIALSGGNLRIALGRDMRDAAVLQQRLLQAQQSLERDYLRLRQLETRYRLLFDMSTEPVLLVEADSQRIREANQAAHSLLGIATNALAGARIASIVPRSQRDAVTAHLGAALAAQQIAPLPIVSESGRALNLFATGFRQLGKRYLLVRLGDAAGNERPAPAPLLDVIERMPDAFVVADGERRILAANIAFLELVGAASLDQVRGRLLGEFIGRPGIDLDLIETELMRHGLARNVGTVVRILDGALEEPVEISAVRTEGDPSHYGFTIRAVARRVRDLPPASQDLPRSVEQLTELVGRASLKDIVRESTDLIERLCIEAALAHTSDNRASAAEILGLSRQSLYSKLHRYGLGNLAGNGDGDDD